MSKAPRYGKRHIDWDAMPRFSFGPCASIRHDEILAEGWAEELAD